MLIIIINRSKACESQMPKAKSPGAKSKIERIFKILFLSFIFILDILSFFKQKIKKKEKKQKIGFQNSDSDGIRILVYHRIRNSKRLGIGYRRVQP